MGGKEPLQPMYDETYNHAIDEWIGDYTLWKSGEYHVEYSYCLDTKPGDHGHDDEAARFYHENTYWGYAGGPPDPEYYRPPHEEGVDLGIQLWETTSEGTPITEVFPDTDAGLRDLCEFAAANCSTFATLKATADEWHRMLSAGFVHAADPDMPGIMFI